MRPEYWNPGMRHHRRQPVLRLAIARQQLVHDLGQSGRVPVIELAGRSGGAFGRTAHWFQGAVNTVSLSKFATMPRLKTAAASGWLT